MHILAIDTGSTSTKIGIYRQGRLSKGNISHPRDQIRRFPRIIDQYDYRLSCIREFLSAEGAAAESFAAVVGRGGLLRPIPGGVFLVDEAMIRDLKIGVNGQHASNLSGLLAQSFAETNHCPAYVVDPVVVDELCAEARLSGLADIERISIFHALNQKAAARSVAEEMGRPYEELRLIVAHMGGGISVGMHCLGKVIDVNNALNGDGPFSPERTGSLPLEGILRLLEEGRYTIADFRDIISRHGGIYSYLHTVDMSEVERRAADGEERASLVLRGMIHQVAKEIGALATTTDGRVDGIILTGGIAHSQGIVSALCRKIEFLAKIFLRPGEHELEALVDGALRVCSGREEVKHYGSDHA